jgi:hypothetical protein
VKVKNPKAPAVTREAEEDCGNNQNLRPESANYRDLDGGARLRSTCLTLFGLPSSDICVSTPE